MFRRLGYPFLLTAFASLLGFVALWFLVNHDCSLYVALWVPSILFLWVSVREVLLASEARATYACCRIGVDCVATGLTSTPLTEVPTKNPVRLRSRPSLHPLRRIAEPDEVVSAIRWFLDPQQSGVTSQVLVVDGGHCSVEPCVAHQISSTT